MAYSANWDRPLENPQHSGPSHHSSKGCSATLCQAAGTAVLPKTPKCLQSACPLHSMCSLCSLKLSTLKKWGPFVVWEPCYAGKTPRLPCPKGVQKSSRVLTPWAFCSPSGLCPQSSSLVGRWCGDFSLGVLFMSVYCHIWRSELGAVAKAARAVTG